MGVYSVVHRRLNLIWESETTVYDAILWRRGELNPRPETTQMAASTCLFGVLNLGLFDGHQHPSKSPSRLYLADGPTSESVSQPAVLRPVRHRLRAVPRRAFN